MVLLSNATLEFQILPRADRKRFLLAHYHTIDVQSLVIVTVMRFFYKRSNNN